MEWNAYTELKITIMFIFKALGKDPMSLEMCFYSVLDPQPLS